MKEKSQLLVMRILIVVFIAISAAIAIFQTKSTSESVAFIAQLMGVSWGAMAGAFLAPFLYGLYGKWVTKAAVWVNMTFSVVFMLGVVLFKNAFPTVLQSPINAGAFCMLAGLIIVPLVSLITPKMNKEKMENVFACYEERAA